MNELFALLTVSTYITRWINFDFLLSRDSDLAPAVRKVKQNFPNKKITVLAPFNYRHSSELLQECDGHKTITLQHISTSLFPEKIYDAGGNLITTRPSEYSPPLGTHDKEEIRKELLIGEV